MIVVEKDKKKDNLGCLCLRFDDMSEGDVESVNRELDWKAKTADRKNWY